MKLINIFENEVNVPEVIKSLITDMRMSPKYINNGWCYGFAHRLATALGPEAKVISTTNQEDTFPGHSVVEYRGKFYDAETPNGVSLTKNLDYSKRIKQTEKPPRLPNSLPKGATPETLQQFLFQNHRNEIDLEEGDLIDRLWKFDQYVLMWLPIASINLNEFYVDEDLVKEYALMTSKYPPIIFDGYNDSIIDGIHRANTADLNGNQYVLAYYGHAEDYDSEE